jgi:hypothetical protein
MDTVVCHADYHIASFWVGAMEGLEGVPDTLLARADEVIE